MKIILRGLILFSLVAFSSLVYAQTRVCFSPNGGCQEQVIAELNKAHKSIDVAMFALTSKEIAHALVDAKQRHVRIRITLDIAQIKDPYSKCKFLVSKGLNIRFHMGQGLMHNKFAVIDDEVVLTGSFNWTAYAENKNAENMLIIKDKDLAWKYKRQFRLLWSQSGQGQIKVVQPEELE